MNESMFPNPIAHRGLHARADGIIENSTSAFEAAIAGGYAIECDLQLTSDGIPVVFHDDYMMRLLGRQGAVADTTADEITTTRLLKSAAGDCPLRFSDFLALVAGRALLQIELKSQPDAAGNQALAKSAAGVLASYSGPVTVESFNPDLIIAIKEQGFTGPRGIITYDYNDPAEDSHLNDDQRYILRHLLHWPATRFDFISCDSNALQLPAIAFWRALGKPVTSWTIKSQAAADAAQPYVDQIVFEGFTPKSA